MIEVRDGVSRTEEEEEDVQEVFPESEDCLESEREDSKEVR